MRIHALALASSIGLAACTPKTAEPPAIADAKDESDYRCERDADCVMSCVEVNDCCGNPCGCDRVRHVREHEAVQEQQIESCKDAMEECPSVGACDPNYVYATPRCVEGACIGVKE